MVSMEEMSESMLSAGAELVAQLDEMTAERDRLLATVAELIAAAEPALEIIRNSKHIASHDNGHFHTLRAVIERAAKEVNSHE